MKLCSGPATTTRFLGCWRSGTGTAIVSREDFIAMKAFSGGPVDLADTRDVVDLDRESLDLELLRRLAQRVGRETVKAV